MSVRRALSLGLMAIVVCAAATGQGLDKSTSLDVVEEGDKYVLTVPVSRLVKRWIRSRQERKWRFDGQPEVLLSREQSSPDLRLGLVRIRPGLHEREAGVGR